MIIAYIYYEHPLGVAGGGIGTYNEQISKLMAARGHQVEVFSGTLDINYCQLSIDGYLLNLIPALSNEEFRKNLLPFFQARHDIISFEIIESPEYGADALFIKKKYPKIPLTLKLHTPSFLTEELNNYKGSLKNKLRFIAGGLLRGKLSTPYWIYRKDKDLEYELFSLADTCSSPSKSLAEIVKAKWNTGKLISLLSSPFEISDKLFSIKSPDSSSSINTVTFIGKLEKRKGVLDLMNAIPAILKKFPATHFRFVGKSLQSPNPKLDMEHYIKKKLKRHLNSLEFTGFIEYHSIPAIIENSHICIYPSVWEAFGYVCLESMAAGRAVIGTNNGGMAEIIEHNKDGILIPPNSPRAIQKAISELISFPKKREKLGVAARKKILEKFNFKLIGALTEELYKKTILLNE